MFSFLRDQVLTLFPTKENHLDLIEEFDSSHQLVSIERFYYAMSFTKC